MADTAENHIACPHCGLWSRWQPELAGQRVTCDCGQEMRFPAAASGKAEPVGPPPDPNDGSTYDLVLPDEDPDEPGSVELRQPAESGEPGGPGEPALGGQPMGLAASTGTGGRCPSCNQPIKPHAVICVKCGFNVEVGAKLQTMVTNTPAPVEPEDAAEPASPSAAAPPDASRCVPTSHSDKVARALEDREDEVQANRVVDVWLPLGLIALGVVVAFIQSLYFSGETTTGLLIAGLTVVIQVAVWVPLMLAALVMATVVLDASFGPLDQALLKLVAVALGPGAVWAIASALVGGGIGGFFLGAFVAFVLYWVLLSVLFSLEGLEALYLILMIWVLQYLAGLFIGILVMALTA